MIATFCFADGTSRQGDVPEPPPPALTMDDLPAVDHIRTWVPGGALPPGATRRAFALEEGGPPHRYREVIAPSAGVVWKFPVPITSRFTLSMPDRAHILTVQDQRGEAQLWALVDPGRAKVTRSFALYGTGHPFEYSREEGPPAYVGTFQQLDGRLVWRLFELTGLSRAFKREGV